MGAMEAGLHQKNSVPVHRGQQAEVDGRNEVGQDTPAPSQKPSLYLSERIHRHTSTERAN